MSTTSESLRAPAEQPNGLATCLKVLFAPGDAFSTLARFPMWGWAALAGLVLTLAGVIILMPATMHLSHVIQNRQLAQLPADRAAAARQAMASIPPIVIPISIAVSSLVVAWLAWFVGAVVYVIGASLSGGEARFASAWVIAVNIYIIGAIGAIVNGVIVVLRGAQNVSVQSDVFGLPSLAMLVHGSPKLELFLYGFNVVNIWLYIVAVIALERVMKMTRGSAIATVVVLALLGAGLGAIFAK